jgi:hypothetical protein
MRKFRKIKFLILDHVQWSIKAEVAPFGQLQIGKMVFLAKIL